MMRLVRPFSTIATFSADTEKYEELQVMDEQEFQSWIALGHEHYGVEFKGPGSRDDRIFRAKVIQAMLGMANRRDGGNIIIGVDEDNNGTPVPLGLSDTQLATWTFDGLADVVAEYADPSIDFDLSTLVSENKKYVVIRVNEFDSLPILCKKECSENVQGKTKQILRKGACYVRSRRKPETIEIPTQEDMRELLDLAIEKGVRKYIEQGQRAGLSISPSQSISDNDRFNGQVDDFLG